jgi:hypothetical protein
MANKKFADNTKRSARIKKTMVEQYAKPIIAFAFFNTQAEAREALGATNAMINKGIKRSGTTRGFRVIKGANISKALRLLSELNDLV